MNDPLDIVDRMEEQLEDLAREHGTDTTEHVEVTHRPRCPEIRGSICSLDITYTNRIAQRLLLTGLEQLGWTTRTFMTGPGYYRTHFEGPWSDDAIDLIRAAIPAMNVMHEEIRS